MISIIIPLYNKAPFIAKALTSVFSQTYHNYEVIIVDDGSTDNSPEQVETLIAGKDNCKLIRQPNSGVSVARNNGIKESRGDYLCFLDADDWWSPTFLAEMASFATFYPDAGLWACNYIYYKPGKTHIGVNHPTGHMNYPQCYVCNVGMPIWTGAAMMRRTIFDEMEGFPVGISLGEDFLLWSMIAHKYKIAFLDKPLAYYNNDVSVSLRATRNLHAPEHHMLWHVDSLITDPDWRRLIDWLRIDGLKPYWLSNQYHHQASKELDKVDWSQQPVSAKIWYTRPIWYHRTDNSLMCYGAFVKNLLRKFLLVTRSFFLLF